MTDGIGEATPCETQGVRQHRLATARVPGGSAPRDTEPKNAPAASAATKSADRRLMRGAPTPLEAGEKTTTPSRRCESLTRPTYS